MHMRVIKPDIARQMSLFEQEEDIVEQLDRPQEVKDNEVVLVNMAMENETRTA